jgi:hypothetical protein
MKSKFSLSRISLMLKADWTEYKKAFLLFVGLLIAANLFLLWPASEGFQVFLLVAGIFSTLTAFYVFTGWKVHRSKNRFLTLPASNIEKFVEINTIGVILFCVFFLIHAALLGIMFLKSGTAIWLLSVLHISIDLNAFLSVLGLILFVCTFQFMCSIALRKYALGMGSLFLFGYGMLMVFSTYLLAKIEGLDKLNSYDFHSGLLRSNAIIEMANFLNTYNFPAMCFASVVLVYVAYLKLKEKQIR